MTGPRTSDPAVIEHRLLDLVYTTDSLITAPLLAYYAPCSIEDAERVLDQLAGANRLTLEVDDNGNVQYGVPNRQRFAQSLALRPRQALALAHSPHPAVAALLSVIVPGAGQLYAGRPLAGIAWFLVVTLGYMLLIVPGVLLHVLCVASAAGAARQLREEPA